MRLGEYTARMTSGLGSPEGLKRVEQEMGELCRMLDSARGRVPRRELERVSRSLAALSETIGAIDRAVRERIRELGGGQGNAG